MKNIIKICMFLTTITIAAMDSHSVVVFNGSSCAGKSSIVHHLKEKLGTGWIVIGYDDFRRNFFTQHHKALQLLPDDYKYTEVTMFFDDVKKYLSLLNEQEKPAKEELVCDLYKKANSEFYKHISEMSQMQSVIVDTIILSQQQKNMMEKQLNNNVTTVFVHVPLANITERIAKRNAAGAQEARYANRVLSIYPSFYMLNKDENGQFNGHISKQEIEFAVKQSLSLPYSAQFPTGAILSKKIIEQFGLQDIECQQAARLIPRLSHDHIVDTSLATPDQCALLLYNQLKN